MPKHIPVRGGCPAGKTGPKPVFLDSQKPAKLSLVTDFEWKQLEGQRIMPVLGAVAALPGAALIAAGPAGAPLFCAALVMIAAAYIFWLFTDGIYELTVHAKALENRMELVKRWLGRGFHFQLMMVLYGAGSVICTVAGMAGEHSSLRVPVTTEQGFLLMGALMAVVLVHVLWGLKRLRAARTDLARAIHGPDHPPLG